MPHSTSTCFIETKSEAWVVFMPDGFPWIEWGVVCSVDFSTLIFGSLRLIPQSEDGGWCHVQSLLLNAGEGGYFSSYLSNQVVKSHKAENSLSIKNPNCRQSWGSVFWWSAESKVFPLCITLNLRGDSHFIRLTDLLSPVGKTCIMWGAMRFNLCFMEGHLLQMKMSCCSLPLEITSWREQGPGWWHFSLWQ